MKKTENNLKNLYNRFNEEMEQIALPSTDEIRELTTNTSPSGARNVIPTTKRGIIPQWSYAIAASLILAVLVLAMLFRSNGSSLDDGSPLVAEEKTLDGNIPTMIPDSSLMERVNIMGESRTPVEKEPQGQSLPQYQSNETTEQGLPQCIAENNDMDFSGSLPHDSLSTDSLPSQIVPEAESDVTKKLTVLPDSIGNGIDSDSVTKPYREEPIKDENRRAMKAIRSQKNKQVDMREIFEDKIRNNKNIYMEIEYQKTIQNHL